MFGISQLQIMLETKKLYILNLCFLEVYHPTRMKLLSCDPGKLAKYWDLHQNSLCKFGVIDPENKVIWKKNSEIFNLNFFFMTWPTKIIRWKLCKNQVSDHSCTSFLEWHPSVAQCFHTRYHYLGCYLLFHGLKQYLQHSWNKLVTVPCLSQVFNTCNWEIMLLIWIIWIFKAVCPFEYSVPVYYICVHAMYMYSLPFLKEKKC